MSYNTARTTFQPNMSGGNIPPAGTSETCRVGMNTMQMDRISQVGMLLQNFITHCDTVLCELKGAYNTETLDACTSNNSLFGYFISSTSYQKNFAVAAHVDNLQQEAIKINEMFMRTGIFTNLPALCLPLSTDFSGWAIRQSEDSEHNFLADMFTSNAYSSMASSNTMSQLSMASNRVQNVRQQAAQMFKIIQSLGMQSAGHPFTANMFSAGCAPVS